MKKHDEKFSPEPHGDKRGENKEMLPPQIAEIFERKGILPSSVKTAVRLDMGHALEYCDTWLVLTEDEVAVLEVLGGIFEKEKPSLTKQRSEVGLAERFSRVWSLEEWDSFRVEELVSGGRIIATGKESGEDAVVANFTNTAKNDAFAFCKATAGEPVTDKPFGDKPPREHSEGGHRGGPGGFGPGGRDELKKLRDLDTKALFRKMMPFFNRYKKQTATVLLMVVLSTLLSILSPFISGRFFYDEVLDVGGEFYGRIAFAILLIAGTKLISVVFTMVHSIVTAKISANVTYDLKKTIFTAIQKLSLSYFNMRQSGGIMTQINQDATSIYWFFVDGIPYFIINIVQMVAVVIILFTTNWQISLVAMIPVPVFLIVRRAFMRIMRKLHARDYSKRRSFNSFVSDILTGTRVVKAFSQEELEAEKFNYKNYSLSDTLRQNRQKMHWLSNIIPSVLELGTWTAWGLGGILVVKYSMDGSGAFTYGMLVTYISMLSMAYSPLDFFNRFTNQLSECLNAMSRLFEILEKHSDVPEPENPILPEKETGEVEFRNVCFEYVPNRRVIDNVSFKVSNGETIGIVGHTGAGKSTLVNLVMRLYDAVDGEVLVDGVNVKSLPSKYIRDRIAIVSQETYVFCGTIADNIRYAVPDASMEEVIAAAKAAGAHDFIIKYPDGYNTKIGTGYRSLSGGELQRVSIARAILKNPTILILDEATAAMDTATELRIQKAITEITRDKTTIIIAHRLSTLRDADRLIVIEDGRMTESGTHEELVRKKGSYYKLYKMQLDALKVIGVEE